MRKTITYLLLLVCTATHAQDKLIFTPQWSAQAQFAGYYVAQEKGFYKQAGIDVEIIHPSVTQSAMSRIRNNESHATTLQLVQAMDIIDNGIPLVNILGDCISPKQKPIDTERRQGRYLECRLRTNCHLYEYQREA